MGVSISIEKYVEVDIDLDDVIESMDDDDVKRVLRAKGIPDAEVEGVEDAAAEIRAGHLADAIRIISRADDRLRDLEYLYHKVHGR